MNKSIKKMKSKRRLSVLSWIVIVVSLVAIAASIARMIYSIVRWEGWLALVLPFTTGWMMVLAVLIFALPDKFKECNNVMAIKDMPSEWDRVEFDEFRAGTKVEMAEDEDKEFKGWYAAVIEGRDTFVPKSYVEDGVLTVDYNPTELIVKVGDKLRVLKIVNAWLYVENDIYDKGWVPSEAVVSIK